MNAASMKILLSVSWVFNCLLLIVVACLASGCGLFKVKSTHDLSRLSSGLAESSKAAKPELRPYTVFLTPLEDNREEKTDVFLEYDGFLFWSGGRLSSTIPPTRVITEAIAEHLKSRGFTVSEGVAGSQIDPLAVRVDGKLWRFGYDWNFTGGVTAANVWVQIRVLDSNGNVMDKEMIKASGVPAFSNKKKESGKEQWATGLRNKIDYVALQSALLVLNSQSKLTANLIEQSPEKIEGLNLNQASLKALSQAIQEASEDFENLSMQMSVSEEAARAEKAAQDAKIQGLMNLQNSLDGVKATLPAN
jgi:hypothetical protein